MNKVYYHIIPVFVNKSKVCKQKQVFLVWVKLVFGNKAKQGIHIQVDVAESSWRVENIRKIDNRRENKFLDYFRPLYPFWTEFFTSR